MRARRERPPASDWSSDVSSAYALGGFLLLVFVGFTLLAMGPLIGIDAYFNVRTPPDGWVPILHTLDRIGQRAVCVPCLIVAVWWAWRRAHSWRPLVMVGATVFIQNLIVLILKVGLARGEPGTGDPSFFVGGMAYPSGHSSNIVVVYGLIPYVLSVYGRAKTWIVSLFAGLVVLLSLLMVVVSVTLTWHWFADLVAGLVIGGAVLATAAGVDHAVARDVFADGYLAGLRKIPRMVFGRHRHVSGRNR